MAAMKLVLLLLASWVAVAVRAETYQAETATLIHRCKILNRHDGYTGSGYVDYDDVESFVMWTIDVPQAGNYEINVRYASKAPRPLNLVLDGSMLGVVASSSTGDWDKWVSESTTLFLSGQQHTVKLLAADSTGPNVDSISVNLVDNASVPTLVPTSHASPFPTLEPTPKTATIPTVRSPPTPVFYDPQGAVLHNVKILQRHTGYERGAYADYDGHGSYLEWKIDIPVTGDYKITVRYASKSSRPLDLIVDGTTMGSIATGATGDWGTWMTEMTMPLYLTAGSHALKLLAAKSSGPNVDWLSIQGMGLPNPTPTPVPSSTTFVPTPTPSTTAPFPYPTSSPTLRATSAPVSGPRTTGETIVYEPKDAIAHKVNVLQAHSGYQGSGYGDYVDVGSYLLWSIDAFESGLHEVAVRYAAKSPRPLDVLVDGLFQNQLNFLSTGDWMYWSEETIVVYLTKGSHSLKLVANNSKGPNINWVSIRNINNGPQPQPTPSPTHTPSASPRPTTPTSIVGYFAEAVVLKSGKHLSRGEFVSSPSGDFQVGLSSGGDLVLLYKESSLIWSAGISNGYRCYMQSDGNLIIRDINKKARWTAKTYNNPGARLIVDDGGYIAVMHGTTAKWLDGVPRGRYAGPSSKDLPFPARGVFYYPWYPETWTVNGKYAHFKPTIGFYSSSDRQVAKAHIDAFDYAKVDLSIASWWGPETNLDRARLTMLMDETHAQGSSVKWTVYHEDERGSDPSVQALQQDLKYLKKWFAWHPAWAHVNGKPVIFVYNESDCEVASRWMQAAAGEWFVVLKLFGGYLTCSTQPSQWHQYGVGNGYLEYDGVSTTIAPGFWRADRDKPSLPRLSPSEFCNNVEKMVKGGDPLQLIVSFNEAGEGTMIESSPAWSSNTKYGYYLDCLHKYA